MINLLFFLIIKTNQKRVLQNKIYYCNASMIGKELNFGKAKSIKKARERT